MQGAGTDDADGKKYYFDFFLQENTDYYTTTTTTAAATSTYCTTTSTTTTRSVKKQTLITLTNTPWEISEIESFFLHEQIYHGFLLLDAIAGARLP